MNSQRLSTFTRRGALLFALALLLLAGRQAQSQGYSCDLYDYVDPDLWYLYFPPSNFLRGRINWYEDSACETVGGAFNAPGDGLAYADNEEDAQDICDANLPGVNTVAEDTEALVDDYWVCDNTPPPRPKSAKRSPVSPPKPPKPTEPTGATLNRTGLRLTAVDGLASGIEFQRVNEAGVGIDAVIALGILDAVDVWGEIGGGYQVCFPRHGRILFLDAAASPRAVIAIAYHHENGFTCASMARAGTIVLVNSDDMREDAKTETVARADEPDTPRFIIPTFAPDDSPVVPLQHCQVTAIENMHFRVSPGGGSRGLMPAQMTLDATARKLDWFYVTYIRRDGWLSAEHVAAEGDCQYPNPNP